MTSYCDVTTAYIQLHWRPYAPPLFNARIC